MQINKKVIIIASALILVIVVVAYFLSTKSSTIKQEPASAIPESSYTQEETQVKQQAQEAVSKILDFNDNTSESYLQGIRDSMSDDLYEEFKELSETQKEFNDKQGFVTTQRYTLDKVELIERSSEDGDILLFKVTGKRIYQDSQEDDVTYVKYEKIQNAWKIISFEPEA